MSSPPRRRRTWRHQHRNDTKQLLLLQSRTCHYLSSSSSNRSSFLFREKSTGCSRNSSSSKSDSKRERPKAETPVWGREDAARENKEARYFSTGAAAVKKSLVLLLLHPSFQCPLLLLLSVTQEHACNAAAAPHCELGQTTQQ